MIRLILLVVLSLAPAAPPSPPAWKLAPSDFIRYERRKVTERGGKEIRGKPKVVTVSGHDIRDEGQYRPVNVVRDDLPALLAFSMVPERRFSIRGLPEIRARRRSEGAWAFGSVGKPSRDDTHQVLGGKATVRATFDPVEGCFAEARVTISYVYRKVDAKPGEKAKRVSETFEFRRAAVRRVRYEGFQKDVDRAIERGVAYLRTKQNPDGSFAPVKGWDIGSAALAILTLVSCDVPRDDPGIEKALAWMCAREPKRTYAQALGLMALDRAYTPASEIARERRGIGGEHRRTKLPDRRAWAARIAKALEGNARSPGAFSYPQNNPRVLLQNDASNTQYAVLGLRAATRLGLPVEQRTWSGVIRYFEQLRERKAPRGEVRLTREGEAESGPGATVASIPVKMAAGFRYATLDNYRMPWASMTCAGIASMAVARHQLDRLGGKKLSAKLARKVEEMTLGAFAWLDAHWGMDRHPEKPGSHWYYYYLYSLERACILTRVKTVGGRDWYFEGAMQLLARQKWEEGKKKNTKRNGSWDERGGSDLSETCFALLFLKRATAPLTK